QVGEPARWFRHVRVCYASFFACPVNRNAIVCVTIGSDTYYDVQRRTEERQHRDARAVADRGASAARLRDRQADRATIRRAAEIRVADAVSDAAPAGEPWLDQGPLGRESR